MQLAIISFIPCSQGGIAEIVDGRRVFLFAAGQSRLHFPVELRMNCLSGVGPAMHNAQIDASVGTASTHPGVNGFGVQRLFPLLIENPV